MRSIVLALAIAAVIFASGVAGMFVQKWLPDRLPTDNSRDLVKSVVGLTTALSALVLGLLVASSFGLFNAQRVGLETLSARAIQLDRALQQYGPQGLR